MAAGRPLASLHLGGMTGGAPPPITPLEDEPSSLGGAEGSSRLPFRPFWRLLQAAVGRKVLQKLLQNAAELPGGAI